MNVQTARAGFWNGVASLRALFHDHPLFGGLVFMMLTVVLLLPPFGGASTDAIKYGGWLVGFAILCFSVRSSFEVAVYPFLLRWVPAWTVWVTVTVLASRDSLYGFLGNYPRYNSSWFVYVGFGLVVLCVAALGKRYRSAFLNLLLTCSGAISFFGIAQALGIGYYGGIEEAFSVVPPRVFSLIGNPNFSAWFVAALVPYMLLVLTQAKHVRARVWWIIYICASLWSLVLFASRGALLAGAIGVLLCVVGAVLVRAWKLVLVSVATVVGAVLLFSSYYQFYRPIEPVAVTVPRSSSAFQDSSAVERFVAWDMAGRFFLQHPLIGTGPGNYDQYYWEQLPSTRMGGAQYFDDAHNVFLMTLSDIGVPGLLLFFMLFGVLGLRVLRLVWQRESAGSWLAVAAGVAVWLVAAVFSPAVIAAWLQLAVLCGLLFVSDTEQVRTIHFPWTRKIGMYAAGAICLLLATGFVVGEYALVYIKSIETYRAYSAEVLPRQAWAAEWAARLQPYHPESQYAAAATELYTSGIAGNTRSRIAHIFKMHPYSARHTLLAAQLTAEVYARSHDEQDKHQAIAYLETALAHSSGYPVVESWAAYFYWSVGDKVHAWQYARIAAGKQPTYYYNWLLLATLYREAGNLRGLEFALAQAQALVPNNRDLSTLRKQLHDSGDPKAITIRPGEPSILSRLHN